MLSTNIKIISPQTGAAYQYFITLLDDVKYVEKTKIKYINEETSCQFLYDKFDNYRQNAYQKWDFVYPEDTRITDFGDIYAQNTVKVSTIRVEFPVYSLESDTNEIEDYILEIFSYINGKKIILASTKIRKTETFVHKCIKKITNEYYEYIDLDIINPFEFCYSDEWLRFRQEILFEKPGINNTGSILSFSLTPVQRDEISQEFIPSLYHNGGVNSTMLDRYRDDCMQLRLDFVNESMTTPYLHTELKFNDIYDDIVEYLQETYNLGFDYTVYQQFRLIVKTQNDIWQDITSEVIPAEGDLISKDFTNKEIIFKSWDEFSQDLEFRCSLSFLADISEIRNYENLEDYDLESQDQKYIELISIVSNPVYCTPEIFKFFVMNETSFADKIRYKLIKNMKTYNISAVNKIVKNIINVDRATDYKSNIIRPVFFRSHQSGNLVIQTAVTENIAINLDAYKSKVSAFKLRIEGIDFLEVGRNSSGVIFKIIPANLPKKEDYGTYYILDDNNELVTQGKYEYDTL